MTEKVNVNKGKSKVGIFANTLEHFKVEEIDVNQIKPNAYNPNRQSEYEFELLLKSMRDDGFTQPILVQKDTMEIVDGEHRWRAAQKLGYKKIPVVFANMTIEQMRVATLRHNRARGEENVELTAEMLRDFEKMGVLDKVMTSLQLDETEVQRLIDDIPAPEAMANEEYSQSWLPMKGTQADGQTDQISMTLESKTKLLQVEKDIRQAHTEEQRQAIARDRMVFRLNLVFTDEEAVPVKKVLGKDPAGVILSFCKDKCVEQGI